MKWSYLQVGMAIAISIVVCFSLISSFGSDRFNIRQSPNRMEVEAIEVVEATVDADRLWNRLTALTGERSQWTDRETTRTYLLQTLEAAGWATHQQSFTRKVGSQTYSGVNIVAESQGDVAPGFESPNFKSSDPGLPDRRPPNILLVGAHYDTVPGSPGADDNATGVATILELAELLSPEQYATPIKLVLFDLEEQGLWGSEAFVADTVEIEGITRAVILEMLGYRCQVNHCQTYPPLPISPPSTQGDFIAVVGDRGHPELTNVFLSSSNSTVPTYGLTVPTFGALTPDLLRSDHVPFWRQGIGAVMVTDTANFRNPHYHQNSDRPDTLDPEFFTATAQVVVNAVIELAHPLRCNNLATEPC